MARELQCPRAQDKVGLKIDYLAKSLGQAWAPLGFKRKARTLLREACDGLDAHWQIVNFQGAERNEGASGCFYLNLALQFPAIQRVAAQRPGKEWLLEQLDQVGDAYGQLRQRLENLVPPEHVLAGMEIAIRKDTDLPALAQTLVQAMNAVALPWLEAHASVAAVRDFEGSLLVTDVDVCLEAAIALGDVAGAERLLERKRERVATFSPSYVQSLRQWLEPAGVNCSALPAPGTAPPKDRWALSREAEAAAEDARHAAQAAALRAQLDSDAPDPAVLAAAWLAEWQAGWREEPKPLVDLLSGARVAALDASGREAVLLALLEQLVALEAQAQRDPMHQKPGEFELDEAVTELLRALLPTLEAPHQPARLFDALRPLQTRLKQDMVTAQYPWGFAKLVQWLTQQAQDKVLRQGVETWLHGLATLVPARNDRLLNALDEWDQRPLDPNSPSYELQMELRARRAEQAALAPPIDRDATRRRLSAYPEQSLAADDKAAVRAWRRWLRRDPVTGRLPVHCEDDDWGGPALAAWQGADPVLRSAVEPTLQIWIEGIEAKPSGLKAVRAQVAALPDAHRAAWQGWLLERLNAFEHTSGATEWATTRMRPGVGAVLGEDSENLLFGLLLWSWADREIPDAVLAPIWRRVMDAAWRRLPEHGARAPSVGRLALRLLAGLGGLSREAVQACVAVKAEKQRAKAAEQALAEPLARPE